MAPSSRGAADTAVVMDGLMGDGGDVAAPIPTVEEKWRLLPAFLQTRGLVQQHLASYDYFVQHAMSDIVAANALVECEADKQFFLKYKAVRVGEPSMEEDMVTSKTTPQQCRLRDLTYSAPVYVDVCVVRRCSGRGGR